MASKSKLVFACRIGVYINCYHKVPIIYKSEAVHQYVAKNRPLIMHVASNGFVSTINRRNLHCMYIALFCALSVAITNVRAAASAAINRRHSFLHAVDKF
jgi:hypothetical protein